ncbi:MAG: bifunctional DNA-formamidopyrimidine glycosylase/DNA-(apurinic or apyrimidinic site) lyase [Acidobacteria bacterium]|nr:MAG: bifunctional DNA-formamidopyrimidine glycosylase/DNA-(apurinic or apyrimidinic site) lyase [Acidobacteriota bacterium]
MPELPEVETIARGLDKRVRHDVIDSVWLGKYREPLKSSPRDISTALTGTRIVQVRRVGKHIVFDLQPKSSRNGMVETQHAASLRDRKGARQWIVHLGMTGRMVVCSPKEETPRHTHAVASLASGRELRFVDPRRFGRLSVAIKESFAGPGTEPLTISSDDFAKLFRGRKTPIKAALLNQKLLHGVGNIYADESLFRAGIRPKRQAGRLSRAELNRLHAAVKEVLKEAIKLGGSSVSDYVDADGREGFFQLQHRVYLRTGEPCLVCKTPIKRIVLGGRGTHYCSKCQR